MVTVEHVALVVTPLGLGVLPFVELAVHGHLLPVREGRKALGALVLADEIGHHVIVVVAEIAVERFDVTAELMVVLVDEIRIRAVGRILALGRPLVPAGEEHDLGIEFHRLLELLLEIDAFLGRLDPGFRIGDDIEAAADAGGRMRSRHHIGEFRLAAVLAGLLRIPAAPRPLVLTVFEPGVVGRTVPEEPGLA